MSGVSLSLPVEASLDIHFLLSEDTNVEKGSKFLNKQTSTTFTLVLWGAGDKTLRCSSTDHMLYRRALLNSLKKINPSS